MVHYLCAGAQKGPNWSAWEVNGHTVANLKKMNRDEGKWVACVTVKREWGYRSIPYGADTDLLFAATSLTPAGVGRFALATSQMHSCLAGDLLF